MSDIVLSKGIRNNLLQLQNTADQVGQIQPACINNFGCLPAVAGAAGRSSGNHQLFVMYQVRIKLDR